MLLTAIVRLLMKSNTIYVYFVVFNLKYCTPCVHLCLPAAGASC